MNRKHRMTMFIMSTYIHMNMSTITSMTMITDIITIIISTAR